MSESPLFYENLSQEDQNTIKNILIKRTDEFMFRYITNPFNPYNRSVKSGVLRKGDLCLYGTQINGITYVKYSCSELNAHLNLHMSIQSTLNIFSQCNVPITIVNNLTTKNQMIISPILNASKYLELIQTVQKLQSDMEYMKNIIEEFKLVPGFGTAFEQAKKHFYSTFDEEEENTNTPR